MPSATKEQVLKYENEHKSLFISLVIANNLWLSMPGKYGFDPNKTNTPQYKAWYKLGQTIAQLVGRWYGRQYKLEQVPNGKVEKFPLGVSAWFLKKDKMKPLSELAMKLVKPGTSKGIGFIPLLIWGVIAIAGFFTAAYIVDETTLTAQEKGTLLKETESTLKALNIPPEKAAEIIKETQQQATESQDGLLGGATKYIIPLGLAFILLTSMNKSNKN